MFRHPLRFAAGMLSLLVLPLSASAAILSWNPNAETNLRGYKIYYKEQGQANFALHASVGTTTTSGFVRYSLPAGSFLVNHTYVFAVTAFDANNNESALSSPTAPVTMPDADSDKDGAADSTDCAPGDASKWRSGMFYPDADNDGIRTNNSGAMKCYGSSLADFTLNTNGPDNCPNTPNANQADANRDGIGDACQTLDSDGDGLLDADERAIYGTDPLSGDTDRDGVKDRQEVTDGTDAKDRGSFVNTIAASGCSAWNGFLDLWNVNEYENKSSRALNVTATLYGSDGREKSRKAFSIGAGAQYDLLVHEMPGRHTDEIGTICYTHDGAPGDLDGAMVYYKPNTRTFTRRSILRYRPMEFALAIPFSNGLTGKQSVPFNTYQPSLNPADAGNLVANWVQLTNRAATAVSGRLSFYGMNGAVLGTEQISLAPGERRDISGHQFGPNLVGIAEWAPDRADAPVQLNNVRYLYDNASGENHFDTAFQLEGRIGSGAALVIPVDRTHGSSILEVSNALGKAISASVAVYNSAGAIVLDRRINLGAHASEHIITDPLLAAGERGIAVIDGSDPESVVAVVMTYNRRPGGGIANMYGIPGIEPLGSVLAGSYNTFLKQDGPTVFLNKSGVPVSATLSLVRSDGTRLGGRSGDNVVLGDPIIIPPHGIRVVNVTDYEQPDRYGIMTVQTSTNTVVSWILRTGNDYVMPTPVRE